MSRPAPSAALTLGLSLLAASAGLGCAAGSGGGGPGGPAGQATDGAGRDKSGYSLFRPTPDDLLRRIDDTDDRGDRAGTPYTVDAGRVQVEVGLLNFGEDRRVPFENGVAVRGRRFDLGRTVAKVGVTNRLEAAIGLEALDIRRTRTGGGTDGGPAGGSTDVTVGLGDLSPRLKLNLVGNDSGDFAVAAAPFLVVPTGGRGSTTGALQGGFTVPVVVKLPADFSLNLSPAVDWVRDRPGGDYGVDLIGTINLSRDIIPDRVQGFVEFAPTLPAVPTPSRPVSRWAATADFGVTVAVSERMLLDVGVYLGTTRASEDVAVTTGVTVRF
jgi:hypothetical protein